MLGRIFPIQFDNAYRGHWLGLWLFVPIVLIKMMMGINSILLTRFVATSADDIPLDSYGAAGSATVLSLFAMLGVSFVLIGLLGLVTTFRYRAMIPFVYLLLLIQQLGGRAVLLVYPVAHSIGTPGAPGTHPASLMVLGLLVATLTGFLLSILGPSSPGRAGK